MNSKMSIERIADRLDTLAEITPDKSKMAIERIANALENLTKTAAISGKSTLERIADAVEDYSGGGGSSDFSTAIMTMNITYPEDSYTVFINTVLGMPLLGGVIYTEDGIRYEAECAKDLEPHNFKIYFIGDSGSIKVFGNDISVSGNAELGDDNKTIIFNGDFTVNVTAVEP